MDNPKELSPLAKGDIEIGKVLPFAIYDRQGVLLLAAGQAITSTKQLDELAGKGLYHNPRWQTNVEQVRSNHGSVAPTASAFKTPIQKTPVIDSTGTGATLQMSFAGHSEIFSVRLIGALGREAFLTTHPMKDDTLVFVKEGQIWEFRSFDGLAVYRFTASVEKVLLSPQALLVLSWPQDTNWEAKPIRSARRIPCEIPATARKVDGSVDPDVLNGQIRNLSTGGAEFELWSPVSWPPGMTIELAFQLAIGGRKVLLNVHAKVIKELDADATLHQRFGLVFDVLDDSQFVALQAFVCEHMVRRLEFPLYTRIAR